MRHVNVTLELEHLSTLAPLTCRPHCSHPGHAARWKASPFPFHGRALSCGDRVQLELGEALVVFRDIRGAGSRGLAVNHAVDRVPLPGPKTAVLEC
jgi:hypothetical protein